MRRRDFLSLVGGAAVASPLVARAQKRVTRIGCLSPTSPPDANLDSFLSGMRTFGYVAGRDFIIEARYAARDYSRFPALIRELLAAKVDLIVTAGASSRGAGFAAQSVPVVFGFSGDPVDAGFVASFARPGGNATGISFLALDLASKRVDLLKEAVPAITRVAVLSNPEHPGERSELRVTREAAGKLGIEIEYFQVWTDNDFDPILAKVAASRCDALLTFPDALTMFNREKIATFASRRRLPSINGWRAYTDAGGLLSYGPVTRESYERLAYFVDRILKGAKPADLPVELPSKLELVVNLKTGQAIGVELPTSIMLRANEIVE